MWPIYCVRLHNAVTGALSAVGLGSVPAWLRPYPALSNGEQFRALLARLVCDAPPFAVVDEFSSVIDRQIARIGAGAFARAWRRTGGQVVLLSCHYDILDWLQPDWVFDTAAGLYERGRLRCRPRLAMSIHQTDWRYWPLFEPHHYLKLPRKKLRILTIDDNGAVSELGRLIGRIKMRQVVSLYLISTPKGTPFSKWTLRARFDAARKKAMLSHPELSERLQNFQFRNIRPKAASEMDLQYASALLEHSKEEITQTVYRHVGATVKPTK